ncbi:zinc dependent phospholipase C family protein [Lachnospiraceae bacterium ZAX-1]
MRKKSHISLAVYIVGSLEEQELKKHKKAFYLGSILPDCKPSFLTTKHEIQGTFSKVSADIKRLADVNNQAEINMRAFCRDLGQVIHYIADYFTFPHNAHYTGTFKDHCAYEEKLKKSLREYIKSGEAEKNKEMVRKLESPDAICDFIQHAHALYMDLKTNVEEDCRLIVALCHQVVEAVLNLVHMQSSKLVLAAV